MELQNSISEIEKQNAEVIALASLGNQADVEFTKGSIGITYTLIPSPVRKVAQEFGVWGGHGATAIIIIDKKGRIRFKSLDTEYDRTGPVTIIRELQGI